MPVQPAICNECNSGGSPPCQFCGISQPIATVSGSGGVMDGTSLCFVNGTYTWTEFDLLTPYTDCRWYWQTVIGTHTYQIELNYSGGVLYCIVSILIAGITQVAWGGGVGSSYSLSCVGGHLTGTYHCTLGTSPGTCTPSASVDVVFGP